MSEYNTTEFRFPNEHLICFLIMFARSLQPAHNKVIPL